MKHLPLLMYTTFCGLYSMQTEAADKKVKDPIFFGSLLKIPVLMSSVVTVIREYILPMQTVLLLVVYNL